MSFASSKYILCAHPLFTSFVARRSCAAVDITNGASAVPEPPAYSVAGLSSPKLRYGYPPFVLLSCAYTLLSITFAISASDAIADTPAECDLLCTFEIHHSQ